MSQESKAREFWITIDDEYQYLDGVRVHTEFMIATESKMSAYKKSYHVIEFSEIEKLKKEVYEIREELRFTRADRLLLDNANSDLNWEYKVIRDKLVLAVEALKKITEPLKGRGILTGEWSFTIQGEVWEQARNSLSEAEKILGGEK